VPMVGPPTPQGRHRGNGHTSDKRSVLQFAAGAPKPLRQDDFITASFGERHPDMASLAAPVFQAGGSLVGALTLSGPQTRFTPAAVAEMTSVLTEGATKLSKSVGFDVELI
jgi:hypothetical protein